MTCLYVLFAADSHLPTYFHNLHLYEEWGHFSELIADKSWCSEEELTKLKTCLAQSDLVDQTQRIQALLFPEAPAVSCSPCLLTLLMECTCTDVGHKLDLPVKHMQSGNM